MIKKLPLFQPFIVSILLLQLSEIFFGKYQNQSMTVKPKKWIWANIDTRMLPLAQNRRDLPQLVDQTDQPHISNPDIKQKKHNPVLDIPRPPILSPLLQGPSCLCLCLCLHKHLHHHHHHIMAASVCETPAAMIYHGPSSS